MEVIILLDHDLEGQVALILDTRLTLPLLSTCMAKQVHKREAEPDTWAEMFDQMIAEMMADPRLTDKQKAKLLAELEKPDSERKPIKVKGKPVSETIIEMRGPRV